MGERVEHSANRKDSERDEQQWLSPPRSSIVDWYGRLVASGHHEHVFGVEAIEKPQVVSRHATHERPTRWEERQRANRREHGAVRD